MDIGKKRPSYKVPRGYIPPPPKDQTRERKLALNQAGEYLSVSKNGLDQEIRENPKIAKAEAIQHHRVIPKKSLSNYQNNHKVSKNETLSILESLALFFKPVTPKLITIRTKSFGNFQLDSKILPSELKGLDQVWQLELIAEKIEAGGNLCRQILNGEKRNEKPTIKDVSDLMWFLQAKAENLEENGKKVGSFSSGALSLEDPDKHLTNYLDKSEKVYQRPSSHIKEFQALKGGVHRGIDLNPEMYFPELESKPTELSPKVKQTKHPKQYLDEVLPHNKRTLMFAPMLSPLMDPPRLLIKMELYGFKSDSFQDSKFGPNSRESNKYDFEHKVGHAWEFLFSLWRTITGGQTKEGTRKERVPSDIKNEYRNLIKKAKELNNETAVAVLTKKEPVDPLSDSGGIRIMLARVKKLNELPKKDEKLTESLTNFYNKAVKKYPDHEYRIGNEVCLSFDKLNANPS